MFTALFVVCGVLLAMFAVRRYVSSEPLLERLTSSLVAVVGTFRRSPTNPGRFPLPRLRWVLLMVILTILLATSQGSNWLRALLTVLQELPRPVPSVPTDQSAVQSRVSLGATPGPAWQPRLPGKPARLRERETRTRFSPIVRVFARDSADRSSLVVSLHRTCRDAVRRGGSRFSYRGTFDKKTRRKPLAGRTTGRRISRAPTLGASAACAC